MTVSLEYLKPVTRLVVISDAHLGRGNSETGFGGDPEKLCAAIETLADQADLVIINGDLYDLDRGLVPIAQRLEYRSIKKRWAAVEATMAARGVRVTTGNHDHALRGKSIGGAIARGAFRIQVGEWLVHVEHGERFNAWVKKSRSFTSAVTWLSGCVSHGPLRPLYRLLRRLEARTTGDRGGGVMQRAGRWLSKQPKLDVMIIGHTHQRDAQVIDERWLLNPGDVMGELFHYLRLDAKTGQIEFGALDQNGTSLGVQRLALFPPIGKSSTHAARVN